MSATPVLGGFHKEPAGGAAVCGKGFFVPCWALIFPSDASWPPEQRFSLLLSTLLNYSIIGLSIEGSMTTILLLLLCQFLLECTHDRSLAMPMNPQWVRQSLCTWIVELCDFCIEWPGQLVALQQSWACLKMTRRVEAAQGYCETPG